MSDEFCSQYQESLFDCAPLPGQEKLPLEPAVKTADFPVWTDNKAKFIMSYLRYFVLLTKHGTYIDGFAGPQEECERTHGQPSSS